MRKSKTWFFSRSSKKNSFVLELIGPLISEKNF